MGNIATWFGNSTMQDRLFRGCKRLGSSLKEGPVASLRSSVLFKPFLKIRISVNQQGHDLSAFVDSGAD
ncbi:hypothetical protein QTP70_009419 [Hemibagrus guttatus]|uniref:Uncharacterized protein n=1 Tax=Hemibagrus guttatus TaxID=175788 RepID=A0AAE0Q985_9TELE|nr:hypothetical protein QTP70_009419 [Hemibagrus guttatus]